MRTSKLIFVCLCFGWTHPTCLEPKQECGYSPTARMGAASLAILTRKQENFTTVRLRAPPLQIHKSHWRELKFFFEKHSISRSLHWTFPQAP